MTKEELSQLRDLRGEIEELKDKIEDLKARRSGTNIVHDRVKGSTRDFPYIQTSVNITGIEYNYKGKRFSQALRDKQNLYEQRLQECEQLENRITKYINEIRQSRIRRIFEAKYIDGRTWAEIGDICNCDRTTAAKTVSDYLKRYKEDIQ